MCCLHCGYQFGKFAPVFINSQGQYYIICETCGEQEFLTKAQAEKRAEQFHAAIA